MNDKKREAPCGNKKREVPYGNWESPITLEMMTAKQVGLTALVFDGDDIYWLETRPWEMGRSVIVVQNGDGTRKDCTPKTHSVRSRVHEYGGGAFTVHQGVIFFMDGEKQAVYRHVQGQKPEVIFRDEAYCFADFCFDSFKNRLICVAQRHHDNGEVENSLVAISLSGTLTVLHQGADFYSSPRLSSNGCSIAFITWSHPFMPWQRSSLFKGYLNELGAIDRLERVAGGKESSVFQPEFAPDDSLVYAEDSTGFWNLYQEGKPLCPMDGEFGLPAWIFGMKTYGFLKNGVIVTTYAVDGQWKLGLIFPQDQKITALSEDFCQYDFLVTNGKDKLAFIGGAVNYPARLIEGTFEGRTLEGLSLENPVSQILADSRPVHQTRCLQTQVIKASVENKIDEDYISIARSLTIPTRDGQKAYGFYYPPKHKEVCGKQGSLPPLVVKCHGGPTVQSVEALSLNVQFWTSRGFAYLDVNYRGSTGFGRNYRESLDGLWGVRDVNDCIDATQYVIDKKWVNPSKIAIMGRSAGGLTVLCALLRSDLFKAGCSRYGVGDLMTLAQDTHKFEAYYLDSLIGPWPQKADIYRKRSPINHVDDLHHPMIFLQGEEDKVVTPTQAEQMVQAMEQKGLPVSYALFKGEAHGFRRADTIKHAFDLELSFLGQVFSLNPQGIKSPALIQNKGALN